MIHLQRVGTARQPHHGLRHPVHRNHVADGFLGTTRVARTDLEDARKPPEEPVISRRNREALVTCDNAQAVDRDRQARIRGRSHDRLATALAPSIAIARNRRIRRLIGWTRGPRPNRRDGRDVVEGTGSPGHRQANQCLCPSHVGLLQHGIGIEKVDPGRVVNDGITAISDSVELGLGQAQLWLAEIAAHNINARPRYLC